jgi:uncharacterized protein (TIGR02271 family)
MEEHIVAVFQSDVPAEAAARELQQIGIPASCIRRYNRNGGSVSYQTTTEPGGGFWSWLLGEEGGTADLPRNGAVYDESVGSGHSVLAITIAHDAKISRAVTIIETHHPVEINEETEEGGGSLQQSRAMPAAKVGSTAASGVEARGEETIPLSEEELEIGKRVVNRGTTRIRRYVVETPVERDVTLHGQRVTVERRRPVAAAGASAAGAFEERTVEVSETEEVPVVRKNAHVTEEVVVRREDTERKETVRDTVRREDVEIAGDRQNPALQRNR